MKRYLVAGLSVLAVAAGVGWTLAGQPQTSTELQQVSLSQHSEHSHPGSAQALAGIRIRLGGSDIKTTDHNVPHINVATD